MDMSSNISHNNKSLSAITLAFMGDCAYEIEARKYVIDIFGSLPANVLHKKVVDIVSAKAQAEHFKLIENVLTEEESEIYKRGRNTVLGSHPKNTDIATYHIATGVESLFGFLYLENKLDRIKELFKMMWCEL